MECGLRPRSPLPFHRLQYPFVKCFATQKKAKVEAFETLQDTSFGLVEATVVTFLLGLRQMWFKGEITMSNELTPEKVMEMGEKWIDLLLATLPPQEVLEHYQPEERLKGLRPEERLKGLRPEERLKGLRPEERLKGLRPEEVLRQFRPEELLSRLEPEEIEAYLLELKKQKRLQDADRQIEG